MSSTPLQRWTRNHCFQLDPGTRIILFILLYGCPAFGQEIAPSVPGEAEAYVSLLEDLEGLTIDPNKASAERLQMLPWITPEVALQIKSYRTKHGQFQRLSDLLNVTGFSPEAFEASLPYLSLDDPLFLEGQTRWRITRPPGELRSGTVLRSYQRSEVHVSNHLSAVFLTERDPGELAFADFWSAHLVATQIPGISRLLLGDFRPAYGQGLIFSRQSRSGAGLAWTNSRSASRIGHRSSTENGSLRGIFLEARKDLVTATGMLSVTRWDAKTDSANLSSFRLGGQHVSESEREHKDTLAERMTSIRLLLDLPNSSIGVTGSQSHFSPPLSHSQRSRHQLAGIDWTYATSSTRFFGEFARSTGGGTALLTGANVRWQGLKLSLLGRRYGPEFFSIRGMAFSSYSGPPENEWGIFIGGSWKAGKKTQIEAGLDRHGRISPTSSSPIPGRGERFQSTLTQRFSRRLTGIITLSTQHETAQVAGIGGSRTRRKLKLRVTYRPSGTVITGWAERVHGQSPVRQGIGQGFGIELKIGRSSSTALALWATAGQIGSFDARIYTFEPDVWGGSRLQVLTAPGQAGGIRLQKSICSARLALRYSLKRTPEYIRTSWAIQLELSGSRGAKSP